MVRHGTVVRPTMLLASLDIKTAFDEAKPKHVARILADHNTHGWLIAALSREMSRLSGTASFESVESTLATGKCGSSPLVAADGMSDPGQCGGRMDEEKKRSSLGCCRRSAPTVQLHVS